MSKWTSWTRDKVLTQLGFAGLKLKGSKCVLLFTKVSSLMVHTLFKGGNIARSGECGQGSLTDQYPRWCMK